MTGEAYDQKHQQTMTDYRDTTGRRTRQQTAISFGGIAEAAGDAVDSGTEAVQDTVESGTEAARGIGSGLGSSADETAESTSDAVEETQERGGLLGIAGTAVDEASDEVTDAADSAANLVEGGVEEGTDFVAGEGAGEEVTNVADSLFEGAVSAPGDAAEATADAAGGLLGEAGDVAEDAAEGAEDTASGLFDDAEDALGGIEDSVEGAATGIGSLPGDAVDSLQDAGAGVGEAFGDVGTVVDDAIGAADDAQESITDAGLGVIDEGAEEITDAGEEYIEAEQEALSLYADVGSGAVDVAGDIVGGGLDIGGTIAGGAANWTGDLAGGAADVAGNIGGSIGQAVGGVISGGPGNQPEGEWKEPTEQQRYGQAVILSQTHPEKPTRYYAITRDQNNNVVGLASDGTGVQLQSVQSLGELPNHSSVDQAKGAVDSAGIGPQSQTSDNGSSSASAEWGPLGEVGTTGSCVIMAQSSSDGSRRFFTITQSDNGETVAMNRNGEGVVVDSVSDTGELPHYPTRAQAEQACPSEPASPTNGGEGGSSDDSSQPAEDAGSWSEPTRASTVGNCVIMEQTHSDGTQRFFTFTQNGSGQTVAIRSDGTTTPVDSVGEIGELPNYPSLEDAEAACPESEGQPSQGGQGGGRDVSSPSDSPTQQASSILGAASGLLEGDIAGVPRIAVAGGIGAIGLATVAMGDDGGGRGTGGRLLRGRGANSSRNGRRNGGR